MKISVAMATCNGEKYLQEQLESIANQIVLPDEIVVSDDASTDTTLDLLKKFSAASNLNVRIFRNEKRLGYASNFGAAISQCTGDLIFLCDQDDFWFKNKISRVLQYFKENPRVWVLINDAEITDGSLKGTGLTAAGQLASSGLKLDQHLLGCCMTFRSQLKQIVLPVPYDIHGHDGWISTLGGALNNRDFVQEVLQHYRRHGANTSSWATTSVRPAAWWHVERMKFAKANRKIDIIDASNRRLMQLQVLIDRLHSNADYLNKMLPSENYFVDSLVELHNQYRLNEKRMSIQMLDLYKRLFHATRFFFSGGYNAFDGWKSFVKDVIK